MQNLKTWSRDPFIVLCVIFTYFVVFAFIIDTPYDIFWGLVAIVRSPDLLITDYVAVGGVGATLMNAAIMNFIVLIYMKKVKGKLTGPVIMALWLLAGFGFFGKNIVNIWPIMLGGYLYSKYQKEPFEKYIVMTILGTALGPSVTQLAALEYIPLAPRFIMAGAFGIMVGFIMPPIAQNILKVHQGFNLYNIGFTTGLLAVLTRIFIYVVGGEDKLYPVFYWDSEQGLIFTVFIVILFLFIILVGWLGGENHRENFLNLCARTGQAPTDYYKDYGGATYINMGLLGLASTALMLAIGADINGPVAGCILTIVGFGAAGKHLRNCWPVMLGCMLAGGFIHVFTGSNPSSALAVLLVTCLAPIAGHYGWKWGVLAGFLHLHIAMHVVTFSGGINLYNNGLAGGFVVIFLLPIIRTIYERREVVELKP